MVPLCSLTFMTSYLIIVTYTYMFMYNIEIYLLFYEYECFTCMYVCAHMCLVPLEAKMAYCIPLAL